jgi:hypothetical protein
MPLILAPTDYIRWLSDEPDPRVFLTVGIIRIEQSKSRRDRNVMLSADVGPAASCN